MENLVIYLNKTQIEKMEDVLDWVNSKRKTDQYADVARLAREMLNQFAFGRSLNAGTKTMGELYVGWQIRNEIPTADGNKKLDLSVKMDYSITEGQIEGMEKFVVPISEKLKLRIIALVDFVNALNKMYGRINVPIFDSAFAIAKDVILSRLVDLTIEMENDETRDDENDTKNA